jgi:competence protein ComEC
VSAAAGIPSAGARSTAGERVGAALEDVRAHPRELLLVAVVAGLAAAVAPRPVAAGLALVVAVAALALRRPALAPLAALALLAAAAAGQARVHALDRTQLEPVLGRAVAMRLVALEAPREQRFGQWSVAARIVAGPGVGERIVVRASDGARPQIGAELDVRGRLQRLAPWEANERLHGAHAALQADSLTPTGRHRGGIAGLVDGVRRRAHSALARGLSPPQAALADGMVLGQDADLDDDTRADFQVSGLAHVLAASGQNVALLALLAAAAVGLAGASLRWRLAAALGLVALYVPVAGGGPSIVRAGIMGGAGLVAAMAGRPASRCYALLLAAALTLALNPRASADVGWQLSFAAVAAIALLAPRLRAALQRRGVARGLAEAAAITVAATLGTAPLMALHFQQASLVSLPANLVAEPAVAPIVWLGTIVAALGQLGGPAEPLLDVLDAVLALPLGFVALVAHQAARAPHAALPLTLGIPATVGAYAAIAGATLSRRIAVAAIGALVALGLGATALAAHRPAPPDGPTISFLDVGQGDATLVQEGPLAVLVDTGPPDGPILERLRAAGVRRLALLVLTHGEADHQGAAPRVLSAYPVDAVLDGGATAPVAPAAPRVAVPPAGGGSGWRPPAAPSGTQVEAAIARSGARRILPAAGQELDIGRLRLRVLWPPPGPVPPGAEPNDRAVVLWLRRGAMDALLTADAESPVTAALDLPPVDILKVAHHGSADPGLPALLARLHPRLAAIEVGRHNTYGHPAPSTLAALRAAVPQIVRTDRDGTVRVSLADGR